MLGETVRARGMHRHEALLRERQTWDPHWRDIIKNIDGRRSGYLDSKPNNGSRRNSNIINDTATRALRTLSSGMMAGITSPARPWFRLTTPDPGLMERHSTKSWLYILEGRMRSVTSRANTYQIFPGIYSDIGSVATSCNIIEESVDKVIHIHSSPIGQFSLSTNPERKIDSIYRAFSMTVRQLVTRFGIDAISHETRKHYDEGNYETWVKVLHIIEPNTEIIPMAIGPAGRSFRSVWLEVETSDDQQEPLEIDGYHEWPGLTPRWDIRGEDVYGSGSPGMNSIGDIRQLQSMEKDSAKQIRKLGDPPMKGPTSLRGRRASLLPGDMTYVDSTAGAATFEPAIKIDPRGIEYTEAKIVRIENRVNSSFFADVWLMAAQSRDVRKTATEINEMHEEKMLQLGPVLDRLNTEMYDPYIDRQFGVMLRKGHIPPPPEEMQGQEIRVEYISIMATAQKMLGIGSVDRLLGFVGAVEPLYPDIKDLYDFDQMGQDYAEMLGVNPSVVVSTDILDQVRERRAQQMVQMQQAEQMQQAAAGAKDLAAADMSGDNALTQLTGAFGGVAGASAGAGAVGGFQQ